MRKTWAILLIGGLILSICALTYASEKPISRKLVRGGKNVALGWTEIPKHIMDTTKSSNVFAGITVGTLKGVCQAFARTVSGAVDVVTSPIGDYDKPAIQPSMLPENTLSTK